MSYTSGDRGERVIPDLLEVDLRALASEYQQKRWLSPLTAQEANVIHAFIAHQLIAFADQVAAALAARTAERDQLKAQWDDGRAEWRQVWALIEALEIHRGGCPDSQIINHVRELEAQLADRTARLATAEQELATAVFNVNRNAANAVCACEQLKAENDRLTETVATLREALQQYGKHKPECELLIERCNCWVYESCRVCRGELTCTCGFATIGARP